MLFFGVGASGLHLGPPASQAPEGARPAPPYGPWSGRGHPPPKASPDGERGPLPEPAERARRRLDLVGEIGAIDPVCAPADPRACDELGAGTELGSSALLRAGPSFSGGVTVHVDRFASWRSVFVGVAGRVHLEEHGFTDPYFELVLGVAWLGPMNWEARVGAGMDFSLSSRLRLGPTLALSRRGADCPTSRCPRDPHDPLGSVLGALSLGARLTVAEGQLL
jgi:hypothetical protein